jgi:glycosyltransferase involved in cell wall biosynthesis
MQIKIYCNVVLGGWSAKDLETGIGGSEELLIQLAEAWAKEHDVTIYMNGEHGEINGVKYEGHHEYRPYEKHDVFISFKSKHILLETINADVKIHWTTEIEDAWDISIQRQVDHVAVLSPYHASRMPDFGKTTVIPGFVDFDRLEANKSDKISGRVLYCSSYDRGLEELLNNWEALKQAGMKELVITYGWEFLDNIVRVDPSKLAWKQRMQELMKQDGVIDLGRLSYDDMAKEYWKADFWVLPLSNPDSELFCINAVKAQYAGAQPLVRPIGALADTVNKFHDWDATMGVKSAQHYWDDGALIENRKHAEQYSIESVLKIWEKLIQKN